MYYKMAITCVSKFPVFISISLPKIGTVQFFGHSVHMKVLVGIFYFYDFKHTTLIQRPESLWQIFAFYQQSNLRFFFVLFKVSSVLFLSSLPTFPPHEVPDFVPLSQKRVFHASHGLFKYSVDRNVSISSIPIIVDRCWFELCPDSWNLIQSKWCPYAFGNMKKIKNSFWFYFRSGLSQVSVTRFKKDHVIRDIYEKDIFWSI